MKEDPDGNPCIYDLMIFNKDAETIQLEIISSTKKTTAKLENFMEKNEGGLLPYTIYKN